MGSLDRKLKCKRAAKEPESDRSGQTCAAGYVMLPAPVLFSDAQGPNDVIRSQETNFGVGLPIHQCMELYLCQIWVSDEKILDGPDEMSCY